MELFLLGALVLAIAIWKLIHRTPLKLPPGPPGLPLIGHMHMLGSHPHRSLQQLASKYGPLFMFKLATTPAIVVSSPQMAKEVLKTHDLVFASRPRLLMAEILGYDFKDIALAPYGHDWRLARKICVRELFTPKRIDTFLQVRMEELANLLASLVKRSPGVITVKSYLLDFTYNVITRILMSKVFFGDARLEINEEVIEFRKINEEIVQTGLEFYVGDLLPTCLRKMDWKVPRLNRIHRTQDQFLQRIIDEHRADPHSRTTKDVIDILSSYFKDLNVEKDQDDYIKGLLADLIPGGSETSVTVVEWVLAELIQNPRELQKLQEELDMNITKDRMVQEDDFPKLKYLDAVIKETMRLHPPLAMLVPHFAMEDCKIAGYDIPGGTWTFVNVFALGRDPDVWESPLEFKPERFIGSNLDVKGHDFELLPFGSGRRICPGMLLGLKTSQLALANLVHRFTWSVPPDTPPNPMKERSGGVNAMETPLEACLEQRNGFEI